MVCQDPDCHEKVTTVCKLIHDQDKGLSSKVAKSSMNKWVIAILGFMVTITIAVLVAWGAASSERKQNKQDIAVIGVTMGNMKELLVEIKTNQVTKGDIYKIVKKVKDDNE